jgi:hypothetical protein
VGSTAFVRNPFGSVANSVGGLSGAYGGLWSCGEAEQFSNEDCLGLHVAATDLPNLFLLLQSLLLVRIRNIYRIDLKEYNGYE